MEIDEEPVVLAASSRPIERLSPKQLKQLQRKAQQRLKQLQQKEKTSNLLK